MYCLVLDFGLILLLGVIVMVFMLMILGVLYEKFGFRNFVLVGMVIVVIIMVYFVVMDE